MSRRAWIVTSFVLLLGAAGCSGSPHPSADPAATDPVEVATTTAPTTTTPPPTTTVPVEAPTTAPPATAPRSTTSTLDEATKNFQDKFGGPRVNPGTVKPAPTATVSDLRCFAVVGQKGFGAHAVVTWSDGVVETLDSPGTYTLTTKAVATGSRGTRLDVDVNSGEACIPNVRLAGQP